MTQINIEELRAKFKNGTDEIFRHKDGGFYTVLFLTKIKQADGAWVDAVSYVRHPNKYGETFTRTLENFADRFTPINPEHILKFDIPALREFSTPNTPVDITDIVIARSVNIGFGYDNETGPKYQYEIIEEPNWETPVLRVYTEDAELLEKIGLNEGRIIQRPHFIDGVLTNKSTKYLYTDISEILIRL